MKIFNLFRIVFFIFLIFCTKTTQAAGYGSDTAVSLIYPPNITGPDNIINTFANLYRGFGFTDAATTCTFKSAFPVTGGINLNGGTLYLMSDLTMNNTSSFIDFGKIKAQLHRINFSENFTYFAAPGTPTGTRKVLELEARYTEIANINSSDWSYDGNYVATILTTNGGNELNIYEFTGTSLILRAGVNLATTGQTVRWHPSTYYLVLAAGATNPRIRAYQFTPPATLTARGTTAGSGTRNAVAWNARGTHVAAGGTLISIFPYSTATNTFGAAITPTNNAALNGTVLRNCLKWAPRGNKEDLIAVTNNAGANGSIHLYNFTGAALNHLKNYTIGIAANTIDWAETSTYVAVGYANSTIKTYQHDAATNIITLKNSFTELSAINSVSWTHDGTELAAGMALSTTGIEFDYFDFNSTTYALTSKYTLDLTSAVNVVNWGPTAASYLIRADATTNYLSIYKPVYSPFELKDVKIFLNNDLTLAAPLTFTGNCVINAQNHAIKFTGDGALHLSKDSTLEIQLAILNFTQPTGIVLEGPTSNMTFKDSSIQLDSDVTWGDGRFQIYRDLTITGQHTFNYQTDYTSTINAFSNLNLENGATFKLGKTKNTTIEPLVFADNTAELNLNNATLHTTGSGLKITKGIMNCYGNSNFIIDWTQTDTNDTKITSTNQGLIFGDGLKVSNDSMLFIHEGTLSIAGGGIVLDAFLTQSMVQFFGQAQISIDPTTTTYIQKPVNISNGWLNTDTTVKFIIDPASYFTSENLRLSDPRGTFDYYLTGSITNTSTLTLDQNDSVVMNKGILQRTINVIKDGNTITGNGTLTGLLNFTNNASKLTWDLSSKITNNDVYLNGGRIIINQDTGVTSTYSFKNTGTVDLTTHIFELGAESTTWNGNLYWIGNGATLKFNNDVTLDGVWTFSGSVIIDGNSYLLDLGTT